ncbi:helix-turn-helix domain-containing protein [Martelella soudanensis]|nr:helix-turn-helix domain-containing protein [Martelella sp. NC18]
MAAADHNASVIRARVIRLWQTGRLSTYEIALELGIHESAVCRILDAWRAVGC